MAATNSGDIEGSDLDPISRASSPLSPKTSERSRKKLKEEREALEKEKEAWKRAAVHLEASQVEEPIVFNVGGTYFSTSMETLTKIPDSYFSALVSGRWKMRRSKKDGALFIDRSPTYFGVILDLLRDYPGGDPTARLALLSLDERKILKLELDFYLLPASLLQSQLLVNSSDYGDAWWLPLLPKENGFHSPRLLYQWSKEAPGGIPRFHELCDNRGPTISLAILQHDSIIVGAYASVSFMSAVAGFAEVSDSDPTAFLFKIDAHGTLTLSRQVISPFKTEVFSTGIKRPPTFGVGPDYQWDFTEPTKPVLKTFPASFASLGLPYFSLVKDFQTWSVQYCPTPIKYQLEIIIDQLDRLRRR